MGGSSWQLASAISAAQAAARGAMHMVSVASGGKRTRVAASAEQTAVLGRSASRTEEVWSRAQRLLGIQFQSTLADVHFAPGVTAVERVNAQALHDRVLRRVRDSGDPERLAVALGWLERYKQAFPHTVVIHPGGGTDDIECARRNEASFAAIELFIREMGSVQKGREGRALPHDTISGYVSSLKSTAAAIMGIEAVSSETHTIRPKLGKQMRLEEPSIDPKKLLRKIRHGLRAAALRKLSNVPSFDRTSHDGFTRWAVLRLGAYLLLRPGEVGVVSRHAFVPMNDLHWGDSCVIWLLGEAGGWKRGHVTVMVRVIKEFRGARPRIPSSIPVPEGGVSSDPLCAFSVLWHLWCRDAKHLSPAQREVTPMFRHSSGAVWNSDDVNTAVHEAASALGEDPSLYGGVSLRIGGATDLREKLGVEQGKKHIEACGRWKTEDIGFIYARATAAEHLDALEKLGTGEGTSTSYEALIPGFVQPQWRHA